MFFINKYFILYTMSAPVQNTFFKTNITGNLDIAGNLSVNSQNVYLGYLAGSSNPNNNMKNVAIGSSCATYQTGSNNVSIGYDAATNSTVTYSGANNVSIGYNSDLNSSGASNGVAIGVNSLIDFSGSIAIGSSANATGFRNIAIGASAFSTGNTSSIGNSIAIGVGASTLWYGNSVAIGFGATSTANDQITIGTNSQSVIFNNISSNYLYYTDTSSTALADNSHIPLPFSSVINSNTSLFIYNSSGNKEFKNVSGRTLTCVISLRGTFSQTTGTNFFVLYIAKNSAGSTPVVRYGEIAYVNPGNNSSNNRLSTSATILLADQEYFQCYIITLGASTTVYQQGAVNFLVF
jgi:acetyltransferase-like isoleucine patch superfamily enzyme